MKLKGFMFSGVMAGVALISGCTAMPDGKVGTSYSTAVDNKPSDWEHEPSISYKTIKPLKKIDGNHGDAPLDLLSKNIVIETNTWMTGNQLAYLLSAADVPLVFASSESLDEIRLYLPRFEGSLDELIKVISQSSNISFKWTGSSFLMDSDYLYLVKVPQHEEVIKNISKTLESFGAKDISSDITTGMIIYRSSTKNQSIIQSYLDEVYINTAMVNLQLAVINVNLDKTRRTGFDWSSLSVKAGDLGLLDAGNINLDDAVSDAVQEGVVSTLSGSGITLKSAASRLTLDGVLNMLSMYGDSKTIQNLNLKTLSGLEVKLRSGESIPYVEDVSLNVNETSSTSGASTSTVETGFEIKLNPNFDHESTLLTIDMDLVMKSLVGFVELSAGNQIGAVTRPQIQDQDIKNIVRLKAGETVLVGGLIYESVSDNRSSLAGLERLPVGSKSLIRKQNALFILMRPTVTVYKQESSVGDLND